MSIYQPRASGLGSTAAYQVAGRPFLTGSVIENGNGAHPGSQLRIRFPYVTRAFHIVNTGSAPVKFHFVDVTGAPALVDRHNYFVVPSDLTHNGSGSMNNYSSGSFRGNIFTYNIKCSELYVSSAGAGQSGFQLSAELTHIPSGDMYTLTGSGINAGEI